MKKGDRFGRWTVLSDNAPIMNVPARCDCGTVKEVNGYNLQSGRSRSCGCLQRELAREAMSTHGMAGTLVHNSWRGMLDRCRNPNHVKYARYGGRGIKVCRRWWKFENFYADMGDPPPGTSLGRIDNDGDYCPENCRWETPQQQGRNTISNRVLTVNGVSKLVIEWAEEMNVNPVTLYMRLHRGWSDEDTVLRPVRKVRT